MLYLSEEDVRELLPMHDAIGLMRGAFEALARGEAINQPRRRLILGTGAVLHSMAGSYLNYFGTKFYSTHPRYGVGEKSSMNVFKVMPTVSFLLWRGFLNRLFQKYVVKDFHPLFFFYFFGLAFLIVGVLFGLLQIVLRIVTGGVAITSIVLIAMLIIAGLQFLLFAMWFDMEYNKTLK